MQIENFRILKKVKQYSIFDQVIGQGSSGKVYLGYNLETKKLVAIKIFDKLVLQSSHRIVKEQIITNLQRESLMHRQFNHENIVKLQDVFETNSSIYFIQEYCQSTLEQYLKQQKKHLPEPQIKDLFKQITRAFIYLQKVEIPMECQLDVTFGEQHYNTYEGICHRDLKPSNIMMLNNVIKLGDFGLCRNLGDSTQTINVGTPLYMSPALLKGLKSKDLTKNDVWAAGIILYEMCYKFHPWKQQGEQPSYTKLYDNMMTKPLTFPDSPQYSIELKDLLKMLLEIDEEKRFTWEVTYKHPWVQDIDSMQELQQSFQDMTVNDEQVSYG